MSQCFLSLSCEEFVVWLRTGSHKIYPGRLIDSYQDNLRFPLSGPLAARIFEMLPSYESTSGVLLVQLTDPPIDSVGNSALHTLDSRHIGAVYAINERNQRFLQQQLGTSYLLSTQIPLTNDWVERMIQHRADDDARRGGRALVEVLLGTDKPARDLEQVQGNTVALALKERDRETLKATTGDLVRSLFSYSRSGHPSKDDIGFFSDLGHILKAIKSDVKPFGYNDEIKAWQKECPKARLFELYCKIDRGPIPESFDDSLKHPGGLLSSLVFLKLTRIVRETEQLTRDDLNTVLGEFKDSRFHPPIIEGVWWCGVYWGFSRFAALFHDAICKKRSPILPEKTTEPVINGKLMDSSLPSPAPMVVETDVADTGNAVLSESATHDSTISPAETITPAPPTEQPTEPTTQSESAAALTPGATVDPVTSETVPPIDDKGLSLTRKSARKPRTGTKGRKNKQPGLALGEQKQSSDASSKDPECQQSPISDQIAQQSPLEKIDPPKQD